MYGSSPGKAALSADVSPAMPIICDLCKIGHSGARPVMSSRSRCAGDIIVKCIVTGMKRHGGRSSDSIRSAPRERCGSKRTRKADVDGDTWTTAVDRRGCRFIPSLLCDPTSNCTSSSNSLPPPTAKVHGMTLATHNIADVADLGAKVVNPFAKAK